MSTLVALVNYAPDRQVAITADALHQAGDETVMGIHAGETYPVADLLAGMLLISGNDAATALAVDTVGMDRFVAAMNAQIGALGLHDSHFTTPVGLDDPAQRSSAYDLAAVATVAEDMFPTFRQLVSTIDMQLPAAPGHPGFALHNLNRLLSLYPPTIGVKPGYTGNAGMTLDRWYRHAAIFLWREERHFEILCDCGIESVAATLEHRHAGGRREPMGRRDRPEGAAQLGPSGEGSLNQSFSGHLLRRNSVARC